MFQVFFALIASSSETFYSLWEKNLYRNVVRQ